MSKKDNILSIKRPDIAKQWHPTKNGTISPNDVTFGSHKKIWWICSKGHEWEATVNKRTCNRGCPICAEGNNTSFPEQAIYFFLNKVFVNCKNKYKEPGMRYECDIFIPEYKIAIEYDGSYYHQNLKRDYDKNLYLSKKGITVLRIREEMCPDINVLSFVRTGNDDFSLNKVINEVMIYIKDNYPLSDKEIDAFDNLNVNIEVNRIEIYNQISHAELDASIEKKIPRLLKEWNPTKNGQLEPNQISVFSNKKIWWICEKGHEWNAVVSNRSRGASCPFCEGKKAYKGNSLQSINPKLAKEWHPTKNIKKPSEVTANSGLKAWWLCSENKDHEWEAEIKSRNKGRGCPHCRREKGYVGYKKITT